MTERDSLAMHRHRVDQDLLDIKDNAVELWKLLLLLRHSYAELEQRVRKLEPGGNVDGTEELRGPRPDGDLADRSA